MKNKNSIIVLLMFMTLFACVKEIDYKGKGKNPVLVLNGITELDSTFRIYLERSFFFLSNENPNEKYIKSGATLTLTNVNSGEVFIMTNSTEENRYDFPFLTPENTNFKIEIKHPDYETIKSEMKTAQKIQITSVDTSSFTNQDGLRKRAIIKWNDPVGLSYYYLRVYKIDTEFGYIYNTWFSSADASLNNEFQASIDGSTVETDEAIFNDILFEGKEKNLEITFYTYFGSTPEENPIYTYELVSMTEETFKYIQSVKKYFNSDNFLTEPIKVFNNIENGFGIFGSKCVSKVTK